VIAKTLEFLSIGVPDVFRTHVGVPFTSPKVSISITNSIPHGSGLGGSSLLTASLLGALMAFYLGIDYLREHMTDLVNNVLYIEQMMGSGGGWQDQIGGLFPGVKLIGTNPEEPCSYSIDYLDRGIELLNERSLVIDTRVQRKAARILASIRQKYVDRDPRTVRMLAAIARNAQIGFRLLADLDIRSFAELLSDSWRMVNEVESGSIEAVECLRTLFRDDLIGMKIGGAGGGGFILAIFGDRDRKEYHRRSVRNEYPECIVYDPVFGGEGMAVYPGEAGDASLKLPYRVAGIRALRCAVHGESRL
jgi:fucokinase